MESQTTPPDKLTQTCIWWRVWGPKQTPSARYTSTHAAQILISWSELFKCGRFGVIGTSPKLCLECQMMILVYGVSGCDVQIEPPNPTPPHPPPHSGFTALMVVSRLPYTVILIHDLLHAHYEYAIMNYCIFMEWCLNLESWHYLYYLLLFNYWHWQKI